MNRDAYMTAHDQLVTALRAGLAACDPPEEVAPGVFAGANLAELLREALETLARSEGGAEALVRHRPGCWEAEHVLALVGAW